MSLEPVHPSEVTGTDPGSRADHSLMPSATRLNGHSHALSSPRKRPTTRLTKAKVSFNARRLRLDETLGLLPGCQAPRPGDLVLARVEVIGHHAKIQMPNGRRNELYVGDEIIVAYGNRYAPNQWKALVPEDLGPCHLAAAGGLAARVTVAHPRMGEPTALVPIGLIADSRGQRINLRQLSLADPGRTPSLPPTIVVVGTSMDSGKTTCGASLVHGLTNAGLRVGAAKVTGTGACGDLMKFTDAGAQEALDFVDAGLPTTFMQPIAEVQRVIRTLLAALANNGAEALVVEVADGLLQSETAELLATQTFHEMGVGIVFAARDALAAIQGERQLLEQGYDVRAVSGVMSSSALSCEEVALHCKAPVLGKDELADPRVAMNILGVKAHTATILR